MLQQKSCVVFVFHKEISVLHIMKNSFENFSENLYIWRPTGASDIGDTYFEGHVFEGSTWRGLVGNWRIYFPAFLYYTGASLSFQIVAYQESFYVQSCTHFPKALVIQNTKITARKLCSCSKNLESDLGTYKLWARDLTYCSFCTLGNDRAYLHTKSGFNCI